MDQDFSRIIETARIHYGNLKADIANASTRAEHIRISALAQEALNLLTDLEMFELGMVYTRIQNLGPTDLEKYLDLQKMRAHEKSEIQVDGALPEFKSPFTPPPAM